MSELLPVAAAAPALEGEVIPPGHPIMVWRSPFRAEFQHVRIEEGLTLADIVAGAGIPEQMRAFVKVWIEDQEIHRHLWHRVRPKAGKQVYVRVVPQGGGGSGGGRKNILASVLMIVVSVAAAYFAPMIAGGLGFVEGTFGFAMAKGIAGAAITMLGAMAISALIPPPEQDASWGQMSMLSSVRNRFAPYAEIPRIFGKRRVYPYLASRPYTEAVGEDRWLRVLLIVGWGPLQISELKIGDTPIELFEQVQYRIDNGWEAPHANFGDGIGTPETTRPFFPQAVTEDSFDILLADAGEDVDAPGDWQTRTTALNTNEASVDITAPYGISDRENDGDSNVLKIECEVEYRATGSGGAWTPVDWDGGSNADGTDENGKVIFEEDSDSAIVRGGRWEFPSVGQWDVRVRRLTPETGVLGKGDNNFEEVRWTALRSITTDNPINVPGVCAIALRMKATDQFNGLPDTINCVAESYLPVYSSGTETWDWQLSRNPAWAYADVMRRRGTKRVIPDRRIDLTAIRQWATDANAEPANDAGADYWTYDAMIEGGSIYDALKRIASHGRAQYAMIDGLHSVVQDVEQETPIQHITPRNSWGYSGGKAFVDQPHALKVQFVNGAQGYQPDERIVYMDGYNAGNASIFETLDLPDCTSSKQAWREGRYHLAAGRLRPETHEVTMDIEQLRCTVGDRVQFAHDAVSIGIASGRIKSRILNGSGELTGFELDVPVPQISGQSYALRVRKSGGASVLYTLSVPSSTSDSAIVDLQGGGIPVTGEGNAGDLFTFGELGIETAPMVVKAILPGPDFTARLTLVDYNAAIYTADTDEIPEYETHINDDTPAEALRPEPPEIRVTSGLNAARYEDDGTLVRRISVLVREDVSTRKLSKGFRVQARRTGSRKWYDLAGSPSDDSRRQFFRRVKAGQEWDVRAKTIGYRGLHSAWVEELAHLVVDKSAPPDPPTSVAAEASVLGARLTWEEPGNRDYSHAEIYESASSSTPADGATASFKTARSSYTRTGLAAGATRYYWVRSVDRTGEKSAWVATTPASVTALAVSEQRVARWPKRRKTLTYGSSTWVEVGRITLTMAAEYAAEIYAEVGVDSASVEKIGWAELALYRDSTKLISRIRRTGERGTNERREIVAFEDEGLTGAKVYTLKARVANDRMDDRGFTHDLRARRPIMRVRLYRR